MKKKTKTNPKPSKKTASVKNKSASSKSGVLIAGLLLVLVGLALLYLNENANARRWKSIYLSGGPVIPVEPNQIDPQNDGKLVYINGITHVNKPVADPLFTPPLKVIALKREVEMYQWQERYEDTTKKTIEGGEVVTRAPVYRKVWAPRVIDSSAFKKRTTHGNPRKMRFKTQVFQAEQISVGGFRLSPGLVDQLIEFQQLKINSKKHLTRSLRRQVHIYKDRFYIGGNPRKPDIGDIRITLHAARLNEISVIAQQEGAMLTPFTTRAGKRIEIVRLGRHTSQEMLPMPQSAPSWVIWSARVGGFILIYLGLNFIFKAVARRRDAKSSWAARIGSIDAGLGAILITPALVLLPVAIAWIFARILTGSVILAVAILLAAAAVYFLNWLSRPSSANEHKYALARSSSEEETPIRATPSSAKALTASDWLKKGQQLYTEDNYKGAIDAFASALYLDPNYTLAYYNRAITYQKAGEPKLAIIDLKSAARLGHEKARAFLKAKKINWEAAP